MDFGPPPGRLTQNPVFGGNLVPRGAVFRPDELQPNRAPTTGQEYTAMVRQRFLQLKKNPLAPVQAMVQPAVQQGKDLATLASHPLSFGPEARLAAARTALNVASTINPFAGEAGPAARAVEEAPAAVQAVAPRPTLAQMSPAELVDRAAAAGFPDASRGTGGAPSTIPDIQSFYAGLGNASPHELVEQAAAEGLHDTSRGTLPVIGRGVTAAPAAPAAVTGAEATPDELQEMFGGPGLPSKARKSLRQAYRSGFVEPYPLLERPEEQPLKGSMQEVGAAHTYGDALATYGVGAARADIQAEKIPQVEAQINAYNATARADARQKALNALGRDAPPGQRADLAQQVANLHAHAARYQEIAGPDIARDPDYGKYVNAFKQVVSPELKRLAVQGGLPEERLLSIPNDAPYVPMAADIEKGAPPAVLAPQIVRRPGTALSSATKAATGGADEYLNDIAEQVRGVAGARQRVAAGNQVWQRVRDLGRTVTKDEDLNPGEVRVAFTDKNQITTPTSPNATQFVAVPDNVAQSVSDYLARNGPQRQPASPFGRALAKLQGKATRGATFIAPIMTKVHGTNIISTVGQTPSASLLGNAASALPLGSPIGGALSLTAIDFTDPAVASKMIEYARYGGTHPIATELGARPLFGAAGMDPRGRFVLGARRESLHPEESPAQVAQYLTENLGNYNRANQPDVVRLGQSSGLTTFAPAGVAFTRSAARRVLPIFPGMTPGERVATAARTLGSALGGAEALSYLKSGHSTFANPPGHRLDIDLGSKNDRNQENYLRFGALFPMVDRGLRMTGIGPAIQGQGIGAVARGPINEALTQTGILPRAALAMGMNAQPRLGPGLTAVEAAPTQFSEGRTLANMGMRGAFGSLGAISAIGGTSPFDADRPLGQRAADALGLNFTSQGTRGGKAPVPAGYDEKLQTAIYKVSDARTMPEKQAIIRQQVKDAQNAGYQGWYVENLLRTLLKTAGKTMPHATP